MILFKKKKFKKAMIKRGLLTNQQALNNQQRVALWHWKLGAAKHFDNQQMVFNYE